MPSRFEIIPDVTADAALSFNDALQSTTVWISVLQVFIDGFLSNASALVNDTFHNITANMSNSTIDTGAMLKNASTWLTNKSAAIANTSSIASITALNDHTPTYAKMALLLSVFVWLFREILIRSTARALLRKHGHAHRD